MFEKVNFFWGERNSTQIEEQVSGVIAICSWRSSEASAGGAERKGKETEDEVKQVVRDRSHRIFFAIVGISTIMRNGNPWQDAEHNSERISFILLKKKKSVSYCAENGRKRTMVEIGRPVRRIQLQKFKWNILTALTGVRVIEVVRNV